MQKTSGLEEVRNLLRVVVQSKRLLKVEPATLQVKQLRRPRINGSPEICRQQSGFPRCEIVKFALPHANGIGVEQGEAAFHLLRIHRPVVRRYLHHNLCVQIARCDFQAVFGGRVGHGSPVGQMPSERAAGFRGGRCQRPVAFGQSAGKLGCVEVVKVYVVKSFHSSKYRRGV